MFSFSILQRSNQFAKSIRKLQPSTQVGNPWQTSAINRWPRWKGPVSRCDIVPQHNQNAFSGEQGLYFDGRGCNIHKGAGGRRRGYRCRQCPQACLPVSAEGVRPSGTDSILLSHVHDSSCSVCIAAYISWCFHFSSTHEHV